MRPSQLTDILTKYIMGKEPVLIKGAPGIGKSDIVTQIAKATKMRLIITHPVVSEPIDYKGLPGIVNGKAEFLPFGDLRKLITTKVPTVCFMDDVGQAPACVQAALMQLVLNRAINGKRISDHVTFVAATNRRQDRAGVTGMLEPVKGRFIVLELEANADDWIDWALQNGQPPETIGFAHFRPGLFGTFKPTNDITNSFTPRTFATAGRSIKLGIDHLEALAGSIGQGAAAELVGFIKVYKQLPSLSAIIMEPDKAPIPKEPAALYAVCSGLVEKANKDNIDRILRYANRLTGDFSVMLVRDCIRTQPEIQHNKAFVEWTVKHKDILSF